MYIFQSTKCPYYILHNASKRKRTRGFIFVTMILEHLSVNNHNISHPGFEAAKAKQIKILIDQVICKVVLRNYFQEKKIILAVFLF